MEHLRSYILRGLLAIIPIMLTVAAIRLLYVLIDKRVMGFLENFIEVRQIPGAGILLVLVCLYLVGLIVSNVIGRQLFRLIDHIGRRIPIVDAVYHVGRQLSESLSDAGKKNAFQKALLIDWNNSGMWTVAFVTGNIIDQKTGEKMLKVFVPKVPNPATGYIFIIKESAAIDPGWTVEEALKMIVSAAIISPDAIKR